MARQNSKCRPNQKKTSRSKQNRRPKEVEVNVDRSSINKEDLKKTEPNDASWYAANGQLVIDAASIPFAQYLGNELDWAPNFYTAPVQQGQTNYNSAKDAIPGICTYEFIPTPGISTSPVSGVNLAARQLFTFLRSQNSRSVPYDAPDIMLYLLAADSAAMWITTMKKAYGIIRNQPYQNRYYPQGLLQTMGFSYSNLAENMAQFRAHINMACIRFNRLAIPADLPYMLRHQWLASSLFLDGTTNTVQTYHFAPLKYLKWVEGATEGPNTCNLVSPWTGYINVETGSSDPLLTLTDIMEFTNELLDALLSSQTAVDLIGGDILKAYGGSNCLLLPEITEDFTIVPLYSEEVLSQIENMTILHIPYSKINDTWNVSQTTAIGSSYVVFNPRIQLLNSDLTDDSIATLLLARERTILNMHVEKPTPADVMVATRLVTNVDFKFGNGGTASAPTHDVTNGKILTCGSEIMMNASVFKFVYNKTDDNKVIGWSYPAMGYFAGRSGMVDVAAKQMSGLILLQQFDWHHRCPLAVFQNPGTVVNAANLASYIGDTRDLDNYTVLGSDTIRTLNEVAIMSLINSPNAVSLAQRRQG